MAADRSTLVSGLRSPAETLAVSNRYVLRRLPVVPMVMLFLALGTDDLFSAPAPYRYPDNFPTINRTPIDGGAYTAQMFVSEQQLAELTKSLTEARAATAEAKARLDWLMERLKDEHFDAAATWIESLAQSFNDQVLIKLRQRYLEYAGKDAEWSRRYGENHLAVVNLRSQMNEIRKAILDELRRIAEFCRSDYQIAKTREEGILPVMTVLPRS
jgi:uncharacterized coiled-coil protein SlyX